MTGLGDTPERHDRSIRFLQQVFPWTAPPSPELVLRAARDLRLSIRLGREAAGSPGDQLVVLGMANLALRLPPTAELCVPDAELVVVAPPYTGSTLREALMTLAAELNVDIELGTPPAEGGASLALNDPGGGQEIFVWTDGWWAKLELETTGTSDQSVNPIAAYAAACVAMAEPVRAWARAVARLGGAPGPRFGWDAAPTRPTQLNVWRPGSDEAGPPPGTLLLPEIDWVGCGAVSQAALAALGAVPGMQLRGRVFDPKSVDTPDLNRSILSVAQDVGRDKASVPRRRLGAPLDPRRAAYPDGVEAPGSWVLCGADDVGVRSTCQELWPDNLIVVATEGSFARISCHAPGTSTPCAACAGTADLGLDPIPTIGPTSVLAGIMGAAALLRLASSSPVARLDALTLRLDVPFSLHETQPGPREGCAVCAPRRRTLAR